MVFVMIHLLLATFHRNREDMEKGSEVGRTTKESQVGGLTQLEFMAALEFRAVHTKMVAHGASEFSFGRSTHRRKTKKITFQ
jgi:hypothetical protein